MYVNKVILVAGGPRSRNRYTGRWARASSRKKNFSRLLMRTYKDKNGERQSARVATIVVWSKLAEIVNSY